MTHTHTHSPTILLCVRAIPMSGQLKLISLTSPSFKQLITHRHTITAFTAQSRPDRGRERKTEGGKSGRESATNTKEKKGAELRKQGERERGKEWKLHYF